MHLIIAFILGIYLLNFGIIKKNIIILFLGIIWSVVDLIMIYNINLLQLLTALSSNITNINKTTIFNILFSYIPAYIMSYLLFIESYKYKNKNIFYIALAFFIFDNYHLIINDKKYGIKIVLLTIFILFIIRKFSCSAFDDLHPLNMKKIPKVYLDNSKYLFIIPKFKNKSILEYPKWIEKIKNYAKNNNKILALHGVSHDTTNGYIGKCEFSYKLSKKYIKEGIDIFTKAFGFKPKFFKAPCYGLHTHNKKIIEDFGIQIVGPNTIIFNKLFHPDNSSLMYLINQFNLIF